MFSEDHPAGKTVTASVGTIIFRRRPLRVLTGIRKNWPWEGYRLVVFGGCINPLRDKTALDAAQREAMEETGCVLILEDFNFLGAYGPQSYHHELSFDYEGKKIVAKATSKKISKEAKFVMLAYYAEHLAGIPRDNKEISKLEFIEPEILAQNGLALAFDQALILADFYKKIKKK